MERQRTEGTYIKKGPWTAEEDEVLINHVKKNGPRDWSSIRSKGLLPRTGKSCRLRWVNKLRPNLKTGCKFSAEEERLVIELQAQFGNKWAKIATYLPGRTDNDVKNFWSTRRKRLERILQAPSSLQSQKNKGKDTLLHQLPKVPTCSSITQEEGSSCSSYMPHYHYLDSEEFRMVSLPDLVKPNLLNSATDLNVLEATHIHHVATCIDSSQHNIFSKLPQSHLDHQLLPRYPKMETEPVSPCLLEILEQQGTNHSGNCQELFERLPSFEFEGNAKNNMARGGKDAATFNSFFDDLPPDMLDYLEPLPSSSEL